MTATAQPGRLYSWTPVPSPAPDSLTDGGQAALPLRGTWPFGIGLRGTDQALPDVTRWVASTRRGLGWIRRAALRAVALLAVVAVLVAAVAVVSWWTQPRRPYGFYRSESPLRLSGFGAGLTETFWLDGGDQPIAWSAFTEWGCRLRVDLLPAGGGPAIPLADAPVATTAAGAEILPGVTPGRYALEADSSCAWTVAFGPD